MDSHQLAENVKKNLAFLAKNDREKQDLVKILSAILVIDRSFFVQNKNIAYIDAAFPIGYDQTISQPSTVARMLMLAKLEPGHNLLELGTGSGWNACLAGYIVSPGKVLSLDIIPQLIEKATQNLKNLRDYIDEKNRKKLNHIEFKLENIFKKINSWEQKYDRIMITAGIVCQQENLIEYLAVHLLADQGILICPYTHGPLIILKKSQSTLIKRTTLEHYVFVPLLSE